MHMQDCFRRKNNYTLKYAVFLFSIFNSQIIDVLEFLTLENCSCLFTVNKVTVSIPYFFIHQCTNSKSFYKNLTKKNPMKLMLITLKCEYAK